MNAPEPISAAPPAGGMAPVSAWRVHLGAHKTATTHLQQTLQAIRPALALRGIDPVPLDPLRAAWRLHTQRYLTPQSLARRIHVRLAPRPGAGALRAAMQALRSGPPVVILSEENLIGETHEAVGALYPDAPRRLRLLAPLADGAPMHLFLAIRQMDDFLASNYAEALRHFASPAPFETVNAALLAEPPRWTDLVARIRRALPGAALTVWRYEDYRAHAAAITAALCGADPGPLPELARPSQTMTPAAEAVRAAEALPASPARIAEVARLYAECPAGTGRPAFRPFTAGQVSRFAEAYAADCAALAGQGCLLRLS